MRLLLVEDDKALGEGLRLGLRQEGYTVDWLEDGASALHALLSEDFDLLVLDLGLPRMSGLQVLRELRRSGSALPVLICCAPASAQVGGLDGWLDERWDDDGRLVPLGEVASM